MLYKKNLFLLLLILFAGACGYAKLASQPQLTEPEFRYVTHNLTEVTDNHAQVEFVVNAHNPNDIGLKNVFVKYELFTEDKPLLKGSDISLELAPQGDTTITVPATIVYEDIIHALGPLLQRIILQEQYNVPVKIEGVIYGKPTVYDEYGEGSLFSFEWPFSRTENITLPEKEIKRAVMLLFSP